MKIFLATQNTHKIEEIKAILSDHIIETPAQQLNIEEGDQSYIQNLLLKARTWQHIYPMHYILADDSGLEVESLNNAPGVISAEYAGKFASHQDHIDKLLSELGDRSNRKAYFVSYMALLSPSGEIFVSRGECHGTIAQKQSGNQGFGYDPIFIPNEFPKQTFADLTPEQKNQISHRYKALLGIKDYLQYCEAIR